MRGLCKVPSASVARSTCIQVHGHGFTLSCFFFFSLLVRVPNVGGHSNLQFPLFLSVFYSHTGDASRKITATLHQALQWLPTCKHAYVDSVVPCKNLALYKSGGHL